MEYRILRSSSSYELSNLVEEYLKKDWKPLGGVSSYFDKDTHLPEFSQAIIKERN